MSSPSHRQPHVVISGYYGFHNLGDELILQVLTQALKELNAQVTVLSAHPAHTEKTYGVKAIPRMSPGAILKALSNATHFISGGGGLFQDTKGPLSTLYYGGLIQLAKWLGKPVSFWRQGIGPLKGGLARGWTAHVLRQCDHLSVRDEAGADLIESLTDNRPDVAPDPVWALQMPAAKASSTDAKTFKIGLSVRNHASLTKPVLDHLIKLLAKLPSQLPDKEIEFILMPCQVGQDQPPLKMIHEALKFETDTPIQCRWVAPEQVAETIPQCDLVIGMRFHSLVLALLAGVPVYGLIYDPKVENLLDALGQKGSSVKGLTHMGTLPIRGLSTVPNERLQSLIGSRESLLEELNTFLGR